MKTKSGNKLHPIGIGTWDIGSKYTDSPNKYKGVVPVKGNEEREIEAIRYSIGKGQNHIDCAELYGGFYTDEIVGRAVENQERENLFIADKLWKTSVGKGLVRSTVDEMLNKLKTDYIDLLYIHAPWVDTPWQEAIPQINELIDEGIVRYFGVSNFSKKQLEDTQMLTKHGISAVQQNFNVLYQDEADETYRKYCKDNYIEVVAYQPLKRQEVSNNKIVQEIAKECNASTSQIALAWLLSVGALPIPKAIQKDHIDENLKALEIKLTDNQLAKLEKLL